MIKSFRLLTSDPAVCPISAGPSAGVSAVAVVTGPVPGTVPVLVTLAPVEMVHLEMAPPHQVSPGHCNHTAHRNVHPHDQEHGHLVTVSAQLGK